MIEVDEGKAIDFIADWADLLELSNSSYFLQCAVDLFGEDTVNQALKQVNAEEGHYCYYKIVDGEVLRSGRRHL